MLNFLITPSSLVQKPGGNYTLKRNTEKASLPIIDFTGDAVRIARFLRG